MPITIYPSQFNIREDGSYEQLPAIQGKQGPQGIQGIQGEDGPGPYEAAVEAGYTGTEEAFNTALAALPSHGARHLPGGDDPITMPVVSSSANGLAPILPTASATTKFLRGDGSWVAPAYPVTSVNGSTGAVSLTIPSKVSQLTNDSGFITSAPDYTVGYGVCSTAADTVAKVVTLSNRSTFTLSTGAMVVIKFSNNNTATSPTLNVNGTGAKAIKRYGTTAPGTSNTANGWAAGALLVLVYDGTYWLYHYWYNTTYSPAALGSGYGTCSTAAATAAKEVTLSNYSLVTGGIVTVYFSYNVPASATLNINAKGAKAIRWRNAAIPAGIIKAGDFATFIYSGSYYYLIAIDREQSWNLLWTNASPGSTFAAQTISLSMASYNEAKIVFILNSSNTTKYYITQISDIDGQLHYLTQVYNVETDSATHSGACSREVTVKTTGVVFGKGVERADITASTTGSTANNRLVPYKIYVR